MGRPIRFTQPGAGLSSVTIQAASSIDRPTNTIAPLSRTIIPGFTYHPTEWIEADKLIRLPRHKGRPV